MRLQLFTWFFDDTQNKIYPVTSINGVEAWVCFDEMMFYGESWNRQIKFTTSQNWYWKIAEPVKGDNFWKQMDRELAKQMTHRFTQWLADKAGV